MARRAAAAAAASGGSELPSSTIVVEEALTLLCEQIDAARKETREAASHTRPLFSST